VRSAAVSVLLPVRDGGSYLDDALESLLGQSFEDFEVVAVDDGSTDGTHERLLDWAGRDARIHVARRSAEGIVATLEDARCRAHGRYLARMDADDVAAPTRLGSQFALMERSPDLAGCGSGVAYFPREGLRDGSLRYEAWLNAAVTPEEIERAIFVECPIAHPTFFMRAEAVAEVGGYRDLGWPEDYDLVLRLWRAGHRLGKVPAVLHQWRDRPERLSRTHHSYTAGAFLACKVHHLRKSLLPPDRAAVIWGAGPVGKGWARALQEAGSIVEAFVELDPRKIGQTIHGAPVLDTKAALERRGSLHLAAVGQEGARGRITGLLEGAGHRPTEDFVAVA